MALTDQARSYMPETDSGIRDFLNNFAGLVNADPAAFGLTAPDAATLVNLADAYDAAYLLATNPPTRNTLTINAKDTARNLAVATFRVFAMQIKANLGVSDDQKLALGLHLDDTTRTPVPAPSTRPLLAIIDAKAGDHTLRYADEETPTSRAKPEGVIQMQLYAAVEADPTADVTQASFVGVYSKQPIVVTYTPDQAGRTATYFARWVTRTGLVGPWSLPVAMMIAFGGPIQIESAA